jgi:surface antigen
LPSLRSTTTSLRQPVVIRGTGKKRSGTMRPPKGRGWVIQLSVTGVLILMAIGTLMAVSPAGTNAETGFNPFRPIMNWVVGSNSNPNLLAEQAATVTAVTQDGYQPSSNQPQTYKGLPTPPPSMPTPGTGGYDGFTYGQCTYWADLRYHQLTGFWVPWGGNAWEWAAGASASGWIVSSSPHVPSIIVLQPGVQGAGSFGHVAVVERINSDGTVYTTNWNWYGNGGGWATWSSWDFTPGPGVSFVWR